MSASIGTTAVPVPHTHTLNCPPPLPPTHIVMDIHPLGDCGKLPLDLSCRPG
uniref:Uncharacterized protein n=1 Tax=Anguilla anguilla TaxID=7936 RepID=A0A0E9Q3G8_ANGAN